MIGEQPNQTPPGSGNWIRIDCSAGTDHSKDLVLLERKGDPNFPRHVDRIAVHVILEIWTRVNFNSRSGVVVDNVFIGEQPVNGLQVIGQSIIGAAEVEPLILNSQTQIPVAGNEKSVCVTELVVDGVAAAELSPVILKIAATGIGGLVIEDFGGIFVFVGQ